MSLKTIFNGVRGKALHIGWSPEGKADIGKNISKRNIIGINIIMLITLATRGDLAMLPIALPRLRKVAIPNIITPIKAQKEPSTCTLKKIIPTIKRTITPRAMKIIWLRVKPSVRVEV